MSVNELIIDSGFFIALFCKNDQYHSLALSMRSKIIQRKWITTWPVLTEVSYFLSKRKLNKEVEKLFELYEKDAFEIFHFDKILIPRLKLVLRKHCELPIDLADASLVVLAEELGHGEIVSTDQRHFKTYRWKNTKPFTNLLF